MVGRRHDPQRLFERLRGIGQDFGDAGERLVLVGIEDVKNYADEQGVAGFLPMGTAFKGAFRVNQNIGNVLDVPDFGSTFAHFQKRIVASASCGGRVEQKAVRKA